MPWAHTPRDPHWIPSVGMYRNAPAVRGRSPSSRKPREPFSRGCRRAPILRRPASTISPVAHLLGCGDCRQRVAEVASLLADDRVQSEVRALDALSVQPKRWNGWRLVAGGLAAAAVLAVLVRSAGTPLPPDVRHREQPVTVTAVPVLALPVGLVDRVDSLVWTGIPRAFQYRVALFREDGVGVWDSVTSDTMMAFPVGIRQEARAVFFWKVEARTDWNRWARSRTGPRRPS